MASEKDRKAVTIDFSNLFETEYFKAVPGSYDESFFTDPATGKFRFPSYKTCFKGMVEIKDETRYKDEYLIGLSAKEKAAFTIDDFEKNFYYPDITIEKFSDFMKRIPDSAFDKGISKENFLYLLKKFQRFINDEKYEEYEDDEEIEKFYLLEKDKSDDAVNLGLLEILNPGQVPASELWDRVQTSVIREVCKANGIATTSKTQTMVERILEKNPPFPYNVVVPAPLLKETWLSFVDIYIGDIRESIDKLHPLYIKPIWEMVRDTSYARAYKPLIEQIIASAYWANRLIKIQIEDEE